MQGSVTSPPGMLTVKVALHAPEVIACQPAALQTDGSIPLAGTAGLGVGFVEEAKRVVAQKVSLPEGVHIQWSGEFEHQIRAARTLRFVFPAVIVLIFLILYLTYRDLADAGLMMLAVPEALAGGAFFMYLFPKIVSGWETPPVDFSVAVWVGFIACFGMATETGIIMLVYCVKLLTNAAAWRRFSRSKNSVKPGSRVQSTACVRSS